MTRRLGIRLAVLVSAVLITLGAIVGAYVTKAWVGQLRADHRSRAAATLSALAVPCSSVMASGERRRLDSFIAETVNLGDTYSLMGIALLDHEGTLVVAHAKHVTPAELLEDSEFVEAARASPESMWRRYPGDSQETLSVSMPVVSGLRFGTLLAQFDSSDVQESISRIRLAVTFVTAVAVLFTVGVLWLTLLVTVLRPVQQLMQAAEAVSKGDFDSRLRSNRSDEVGRLSHAFDQMADQLQSYTQGLERRVAEESAEVARQSQQLHEVNARLQVAVTKLERLAVTDELTGLSNRRHFDHLLQSELARSARSHIPLSLLMIDVDHFKSYNDTYGHPAGDIALKLIAHTLQTTLRRTDCTARWGGEEFAVLLFKTEAEYALQVANKLRNALHAVQTKESSIPSKSILTVSIGIASAPKHADDSDTLLQLADTALYAAKRSGRDKAVVTTGATSIEDITIPADE
ncbi:MAG: diguanylate cyclase [Myxococcota bacterium]|nr:diguanylate cyclase [Myxococcota bacterium]